MSKVQQHVMDMPVHSPEKRIKELQSTVDKMKMENIQSQVALKTLQNTLALKKRGAARRIEQLN